MSFAIQSKSILAKLLAIENITIQHDPEQKTAWFDVKNRVLSLPVWHDISEDLYDMLVVHEVGHALDTPADAWINNIRDIAERVTGKKGNAEAESAVKDFMNVIEDARIDKRQKRRYPGSVRNYVAGYKELIDRNFFGTANRDINSFSFIDRMNMYFKGGILLGIKFSDVERKFIDAVANAETFDEVIALTEEIFTYAKGTEKFTSLTTRSQVLILDEDGDFDVDEEDVVFDDFEDFDDEDEDVAEKTSGKGFQKSDEDEEDDSEGSGDYDEEDEETSEEDENTDEEDEDKGKTGGFGKEGGFGQSDNELPQSETEQSFREMQNQIVKDDGFQYIYGKLPDPDLSKIVDDYKVVLNDWENYVTRVGPDWKSASLAQFNTWKSKENATISFMVKEFEMLKAASAYSKTLISKTGVIDTSKLHNYRYCEDIFRKNTVVPKGKNHGFILVIDWSGSMHPNIHETVLQAFSLAMFCRRVQIPFEVYTFRDWDSKDTPGAQWNYDRTTPYLNLNIFKMRNILSSRMNSADFTRAMAYLYSMTKARGRFPSDGMGGTPLNEAIVAMTKIVPQFQARNKIEVMNVIFLSDGYGNTSTMTNFQGYKFRKMTYIKDDVTKKNYLYDDSSKYYNTNAEYHEVQSGALYSILKDRTNCNLVGFYLAGNELSRLMREMFGDNAKTYRDLYAESWKKEGFFARKAIGFDEYYYLNTDKFKVSTDKLEVNSDMSVNAITKKFTQFSEQKGTSRVLLRKFISRISRNVA